MNQVRTHLTTWLPRDYESNTVLLCLVRSKRYSSLKFCIWPVLLYSVIIEDYIYVRVLARKPEYLSLIHI